MFPVAVSCVPLYSRVLLPLPPVHRTLLRPFARAVIRIAYLAHRRSIVDDVSVFEGILFLGEEARSRLRRLNFGFVLYSQPTKPPASSASRAR
eukprot:6207809-Pleurochrysis_carterae.AAC.1